MTDKITVKLDYDTVKAIADKLGVSVEDVSRSILNDAFREAVKELIQPDIDKLMLGDGDRDKKPIGILDTKDL